MRFRLRKEKGCKAGNHIEPDPKTGIDVVYKAGDIIETNRDLRKIFGGKFERIPTAEDFANPDGSPNIIDKRFESPEAEKEALLNRLQELNAKDDSEDEEDDNKTKDDNSEDTPDDATDENTEDEEDDSDDDDDEEDEDEEVDPTTLGEDVTDKFPKAKELKVKVFMTGKSWYVAFDPADNTLLNEDGTKLRKVAMEELLDSLEDEE